MRGGQATISGKGAVAVTGDVGAGKSTVSRLLASLLGCPRYDADALALALWRRDDVAEAAVARWGAGILGPGGEVDRRRVAARVFSSPQEYQWCCALLHPPVMEELGRLAAGRAVMEIPLLFEVGRPRWASAVVFVTAPMEARLERCRERGWDEGELRRRESFFLPSGERMRLSDFVIVNDGDRGRLEAEVRRVAAGMTK